MSIEKPSTSEHIRLNCRLVCERTTTSGEKVIKTGELVEATEVAIKRALEDRRAGTFPPNTSEIKWYVIDEQGNRLDQFDSN